MDDRTGQESTLYTYSIAEKTFSITPRVVVVQWSESPATYWIYNGDEKHATATITNKLEGDTVDIDTYTIEKYVGTQWASADEAIDAGMYRFTVASLKDNTNDNYTITGATGLTSGECNITPKSLAGVQVVVESTSSEYNGTLQLPDIASVTDPEIDGDRENLVLGKDYLIADSSKLKDVQAVAVPILLTGTGNYNQSCTSAT